MKLLVALCLIWSASLKAAPMQEDRARALWHDALDLGIKNKTTEAAHKLQKLLDAEQNAVDRNLVLLTVARFLYQDGKFDAAIKFDDMVAKQSDYWGESREEKAWAQVRKEDYEGALATLKTAMNPLFAGEVSSEVYYLKGLADEKVCDYPAALTLLKEFKDRYSSKIAALESLTKTGQSPEVSRALAKMSSARIAVSDLGPDAMKLPRLINRDEMLASKVSNEKKFEHVKELASEELKEIKKTLARLQLVETDATQRMHANAKLAQSKADKKTDSDALVFPAEDEVWLDEIDHYQVTARGCPTAKGRSP